MYEAQVGDTFETKSGKRVFVTQRDPLQDRVQLEFEDSGRTRWVSNADLWDKYTFVD